MVHISYVVISMRDVAPIKIETCRYGINRIPVNERLCESCESVEDEYHVNTRPN